MCMLVYRKKVGQISVARLCIPHIISSWSVVYAKYFPFFFFFIKSQCLKVFMFFQKILH